MATEFSREFFADNRIVKAELRSARKPREEELNRIRAEVLCDKCVDRRGKSLRRGGTVCR